MFGPIRSCAPPPAGRRIRRAQIMLGALALTILLAPLLLFAPSARAQTSTTIANPAAVAPVRLFAGWNDIVYQGISLPVQQALAGIVDAVPIVWEFDAPTQRWNVWAAAAPAAARTLPRLQTGGLYFLRATRATFWLPPLSAPPPADDTAVATADDTPPGDPDGDSDAAVVPGLWEVRFSRTTPLFALEDVLVFDETGAGRVETLGAPSRAIALDAPRLAGIAGALTANDFLRQQPQDARSGCVSCFHYLLTIRAPDGSTVSIQTDDVGLSGALLTTVDQLVAALLDALSGS